MSVFGNPSDNEGTVNEDATILDGESSDNVDSLIGEGKKYSNAEEALRSLPFKEDHIQKLESENAELRKKLMEEMAKIKDSLDEIRAPKDEPKTEAIDQNAIAELIDSRLSANVEAQKRKENEKLVVAKLLEKYGDKEKAEAAYIKKANDLGIGVETFNELAGRSPKAILEYFNSGSSSPQPAGVTRSTVNTEVTIGDSDQRTYKYWESWRKQHGNDKYFSSKIQTMVDRDMKRLGSKFFD